MVFVPSRHLSDLIPRPTSMYLYIRARLTPGGAWHCKTGRTTVDVLRALCRNRPKPRICYTNSSHPNPPPPEDVQHLPTSEYTAGRERDEPRSQNDSCPWGSVPRLAAIPWRIRQLVPEPTDAACSDEWVVSPSRLENGLTSFCNVEKTNLVFPNMFQNLLAGPLFGPFWPFLGPFFSLRLWLVGLLLSRHLIIIK